MFKLAIRRKNIKTVTTGMKFLLPRLMLGLTPKSRFKNKPQRRKDAKIFIIDFQIFAPLRLSGEGKNRLFRKPLSKYQ